MKIEIWSDFVCPFCYIGKRRLEQALEQFPHREDVEVVFRSFELDPNAKKETPLTIHELIAQKYGITVEEAKRANADIGKQAEAVGLTFRFETMKPTNTFDAHRLAHYAKEKGKLNDVVERLFYAYFTESKRISNRDVLFAIAEAAGLDRKEAEAVLDGGRYAEQVREDEAAAARFGVRGVPFFVLNGKYAISGAQPVDVFRRALEKVWEEEQQASPLRPLAGEGGMCADGSCSIG
ncbi:DsbA family oxidoreductase [Geobacillus proteiniphilus]|uniref:2-hydroxychromene-2-carboxylate isomerase/DsbA-like thioredoxin domain n=1 Tax=Geobacillus proteiniphilus TaxID=860353 RepID=A0A1Q5SU58_9BACL|nr:MULTISPECIES: DsbA family oxidoreductase [Geobacillus]OKO91548.1 2-hydroxychromene-2-carboxylate isomerase/DsbA-like thioredoxin domain [Geobacillus proteiniphilus]OPX03246.1 disulfide bond formation protein DsbA [Geobacillus sp. LEMMY01]WMJ16021.1 DsbA family oxidoreductase [Geobacillus proteiniphilus]